MSLPDQDAAAPDPVEEASEESFPASDPPSWTLTAGHHEDETEASMPNTPSTYRGGDLDRSWAPSPLLALRQMSRLFDDVFMGAAAGQQGAVSANAPRIDVVETDKEIRIKADLPGVDEKDVEVTVDDDLLTIRGETKLEREEERQDFRLLERARGVFQRTIRLPFPVDADQVRADFTNGVLTLTVPKARQQDRGRRVQIGDGGVAKDQTNQTAGA